jgi:hypothetical protein
MDIINQRDRYAHKWIKCGYLAKKPSKNDGNLSMLGNNRRIPLRNPMNQSEILPKFTLEISNLKSCGF